MADETPDVAADKPPEPFNTGCFFLSFVAVGAVILIVVMLLGGKL